MPYFNELSIDAQIKVSMVTDDEPRKTTESIIKKNTNGTAKKEFLKIWI